MNVGGVYAALRDDIREGSRRVTGFDHAVRFSRIVEALLMSSDEGRRIKLAG